MAGKFLTIFLLLTLSLGGGYVCRKLRLAGDRTAAWLMTAVSVLGYPIVNLLAIWDTELHASDLWLPGLSVAQIFLLTVVGLAMGKCLTADRGERGLFAISTAFGNHGLTMGGFVVFLLFGEQALGLASIYFMLFTPITVLLAYPLARHYATDKPSGSLAGLLMRSLLDWRSIGLPISVVAILLSPSVLAVPRPAFVKDFNLVDKLVYVINVAAYFGIGLQLRMSYVPALKKLIAGLFFTRYIVGAATGAGLLALTMLTPWPVYWNSLGGKVVLIQSFTSTAVAGVAVASMFNLKPREASVLFVTNTLSYLILVLPIVLWIYR